MEFLARVTELFIENGAKAVTMDDVAKHLSISKRTLYETYANKEELLAAVLDFKLGLIIEKLRVLESEPSNAIEKVLLKGSNFEEFSNTNHSVFIRQLMKYYPAILDRHILNVNEKISEVLFINIKQGREENLYRQDFNESLQIRFLLQIMLSFEDSVLFESEQCSRSNYCCEGVMFYLYSITTEKGRQVLEQLLKKYEQQFQNIKEN